MIQMEFYRCRNSSIQSIFTVLYFSVHLNIFKKSIISLFSVFNIYTSGLLYKYYYGFHSLINTENIVFKNFSLF